MNKYSNGKIYTIRCHDDQNLIYVGSTIQPLYKRWHQHKLRSQCETDKEYHKYIYTKIRELGIDKFYIELYENFECKSKEELCKKEGEVIRLIGNLKQQIAGRTRKEWRQENPEKTRIYRLAGSRRWKLNCWEA